MTIQLQRVLWLWAGMLVLALLLMLPLAAWICAVVVVGMVSVAAVGWVVGNRRAARLRESVKLAANVSMPPASFRQPVVLVCGDGLEGLFGSIADHQLAVRVTHQGCYVRVPALDLLPNVTESIQALRPGWGPQLSVMFIINPAAHSDEAELAGRIRTFRHQATLAGRQGASMPLTLVSYFHASRGEAPWFCWTGGQPTPRVLDAGACADLADWLQQPTDSSWRAMRMQAGVQLENAAAWLHKVVLPHFNACTAGTDQGSTVCWAVRPVPELPQALEGNLWAQWLRKKVALADPRPAVTNAMLPFPDPLLSLIPLRGQRTSVQRAGIIAIWMFALAGAVALANSAWQNTLLVRQVTDDLRRYAPRLVESQPHRTSRWHQEAEAILGEAAHRLDTYHRHGEPLALGLGLYRGAPLREPLLAALSHRRAPSGPMALPASEPLRLDSLSLFSPGSARLKPDATKVLIKALVGIKAQPGWLIVIAGHTDATGDAAQNLRLSRERAAAVHEWMLRMGGVPDSCFAVQGFGASQPIASNDTAAGRAANRRVDIRLVPEAGACALPTTGTDRQPPSHPATFNYEKELHMAIPVYLWLQDDGGAEIKGSVDVQKREGSIEVVAQDHSLYIPTDNNTGKLTGARVHTPFLFSKEIDASSPYLYKAVTKGQTLKSAEFKWYRIDDAGQEVEYFITKLESVKVVKVAPKMHDIKDPTKEKYNHLEQVELRYEKITWTYKDGNIIHSDSWSERQSA